MSPPPSTFGGSRLASRERANLLNAIKDACRHAPGTIAPILVFDLDGTLLDNRPRVAHIFRSLAEEWGAKHPEAAAKLARIQSDDVVYGTSDNLTRLGIEDASLHEEAFAFWRNRFFYDDYLKHDIEVPGAAAYVRSCYEAGAVIVYLTGRDLPNMALGTFASLRDLGFPIGVVGTSLVTKPTFEMPDTAFKSEVAPALGRLGRVIASFDNEPANVNLFLEHHPNHRAVLLDTQHAPNPPPLATGAVVVDTFET